MLLEQLLRKHVMLTFSRFFWSILLLHGQKVISMKWHKYPYILFKISHYTILPISLAHHSTIHLLQKITPQQNTQHPTWEKKKKKKRQERSQSVRFSIGEPTREMANKRQGRSRSPWSSNSSLLDLNLHS